MDYYSVKCGARVITEQGSLGTIIHVFSGSLSGAVEVKLDNGRTVIERSHTLKSENPS